MDYLVCGDLVYVPLGDREAMIICLSGREEEAFDLVIPKELDGFRVTAIKDGAFMRYRKLLSVAIPDGVAEIGAYTFHECSSLKRVVIPGSVTEISLNAFDRSDSLVLAVFPGSFAEEYAIRQGIPYVFVDPK